MLRYLNFLVSAISRANWYFWQWKKKTFFFANEAIGAQTYTSIHTNINTLIRLIHRQSYHRHLTKIASDSRSLYANTIHTLLYYCPTLGNVCFAYSAGVLEAIVHYVAEHSHSSLISCVCPLSLSLNSVSRAQFVGCYARFFFIFNVVSWLLLLLFFILTLLRSLSSATIIDRFYFAQCLCCVCMCVYVCVCMSIRGCICVGGINLQVDWTRIHWHPY